MVNYKCPRCGFQNNIKTKYIQHLKRKYICSPLICDNDLSEEYNKYGIKAKISNYAKSTENYAKSTENYAKSTDCNYDDTENMDTENELLVYQECESKEKLELHLKKKYKMPLSYNNIYKFNGKTLGKNIFKNKKNAGEIYIIQTDYMTEDLYKIGVTTHISKRICQYRTANSYEPRLHYYFPCQDIKAIDEDLNKGLEKFNIKREVFKGDLQEIKECIADIIKKKFNLTEIKVIEPEIKLGDVRECRYCNKCFYESKDLFKHFNSCSDYREFLNKKSSYICKYCERSYTTNSNLNKHLKSCKEKAKDDEEKANLLDLVNVLNQQLKEQKEQMKEQLLEHKKQINEQNKQITELIKKAGIQNSNITNNIQNNIKILAYKNTDISHLTDNDYLYCLNRSNMCIPNLIKKIHFNPKKPENHNIYISNIKNKYIMTYDGNKWNLNSQNDTINDLIDNNEIVIEQKLEEWIENGKEYPAIMKKFNRYLEKKEKDEIKNAIKEEIKLMLFNNRQMVSNI